MKHANLDLDRRESQRESTCFHISLLDEKGLSVILKAVNQSESGLYVLFEGIKRPALGALVQVISNEFKTTEENKPLNMLVTRIDCDGLGLRYVESINK